MEKIESSKITNQLQDDECLSLFKEIQIMLTFNPKYNKILHLKNKDEKCSLNNPPRYITMYIENNFNINIHNVCYELGTFFGMASFHNKISLDDVEVILDKNNNVYVVDFGMCRDVSLLVDTYLNNTNDETLEILLDEGIASFTTPFLTKECFPTPKNGEYWISFVKGLKLSIHKYTKLSEDTINIVIEKLEEFV